MINSTYIRIASQSHCIKISERNFNEKNFKLLKKCQQFYLQSIKI